MDIKRRFIEKYCSSHVKPFVWSALKDHQSFDSICQKLDLDYYIGYHCKEQIETFGLYNSDYVHTINLKEDTPVSESNHIYADVCMLYYIWKNKGKRKNVAINHYHRFFDIPKISCIEDRTIYSLDVYHINSFLNLRDRLKTYVTKEMFSDEDVISLIEKRGYKYTYSHDNYFYSRESFILPRDVFDSFMEEFDDFLNELWKIKGATPPDVLISRFVFEPLVSIIMHNIADKIGYKIVQAPKIFISYDSSKFSADAERRNKYNLG